MHFSYIQKIMPILMVHTHNLSTQEAEVGGSQVQGQPG
jgi:hypothetical protein